MLSISINKAESAESIFPQQKVFFSESISAGSRNHLILLPQVTGAWIAEEGICPQSLVHLGDLHHARP